ncbi:MAG: hypothetical protein QXL17_00005, partial [Candidatus Thermoplasmatota archaeon]
MNNTTRKISGKFFSPLISAMLLLSTMSALLVGFMPTALADVSAATVSVTPPVAGTENATYNIAFTLGAGGGLTLNEDWVNITFPAGTILNNTYLEGTVSHDTTTRPIETNFTIVDVDHTLNITMPINVSNGGQIWINLTKGITNPTIAGSYNLSINTSKEPVSVLSVGYTIVAAGAASMSITQQPTATVAGVAIAPPVTVLVVDAFSNPVSGVNVVVAPYYGNFSFASGTTTRTTAGNGVATFNDLVIDTAGTGYRLNFSVSGISNVTSDAFNVVAAGAASMSITQQPTATVAGVAIAPPVTVLVVDA